MWPPEDQAGLAEVRARAGIPTAAGENYGTACEFRHPFEADAVTYAQPSVTKIGGVTEMRRVLTLADTLNVQVVPHSAYFGPGLIASIHGIAAMARDTPSSASTATSPRTCAATRSIPATAASQSRRTPASARTRTSRLVEKLRTA